jgi:hypothetical protein
MLEEFKKFVLRGNVVDLAVGIVIGVAFGAIVASLVGDIIMPIVGAITGGLGFSKLLSASILQGHDGDWLRGGEETGCRPGIWEVHNRHDQLSNHCCRPVHRDAGDEPARDSKMPRPTCRRLRKFQRTSSSCPRSETCSRQSATTFGRRLHRVPLGRRYRDEGRMTRTCFLRDAVQVGTVASPVKGFIRELAARLAVPSQGGQQPHDRPTITPESLGRHRSFV